MLLLIIFGVIALNMSRKGQKEEAKRLFLGALGVIVAINLFMMFIRMTMGY